MTDLFPPGSDDDDEEPPAPPPPPPPAAAAVGGVGGVILLVQSLVTCHASSALLFSPHDDFLGGSLHICSQLSLIVVPIFLLLSLDLIVRFR